MFMYKIYKNFIFILVLFISNIAFADMVDDKPRKQTELPSAFFTAVNEQLSLSSKNIFYNQMLEPRALESFDNRFIIVHFWASWCMECKNEIIALNDLQKEFRKKHLLVIAISEDFKGSVAIDDYFTRYKIDYLDIYIDKKNKIYQGLNINHLPATYLMNFDGRIIAKSIPGYSINWYDKDIRNYLDDMVVKHQLLPPEYKKTRDKFELPKEDDKNKKPIQKKSRIFNY